MRIVITGGMGCGKSTIVSSLISQLPNYSLFDFDGRVRELYNDPTIRLQLMGAFGVTSREEIRHIVYSDRHAMAALGEIMNKRLIRDAIHACEARNVVLDVPLFFEIVDATQQSFDCIDLVVGVHATKDVQYQRIQARNGYSVEFIDKILEHQLSSEEKARRSGVVIDTSRLSLNDVDVTVSQFISDNKIG